MEHTVIPEMGISVVAAKEFLNHDTSKLVSNAELMAFWKPLTIEEKQQFTREATSLMHAV